MSALASLANNYSDSEDEGISSDGTNGTNDTKSDTCSFSSAPISSPSTSVISSIASSPQKFGLVNYDLEMIILARANMSSENKCDYTTICDGVIDEDDGLIPPEPPGTCSAELQQKITNLYNSMIDNDLDIMKTIQQSKSFKNPYMYENATQFCGIDEYGTNYIRDEEDSKKWTQYMDYEDLAKDQNELMHRLSNKTNEGQVKVDMVQGTVKPSVQNKENVRRTSNRLNKTSGDRAKVEVVYGIVKTNVNVLKCSGGNVKKIDSVLGKGSVSQTDSWGMKTRRRRLAL